MVIGRPRTATFTLCPSLVLVNANACKGGSQADERAIQPVIEALPSYRIVQRTRNPYSHSGHCSHSLDLTSLVDTENLSLCLIHALDSRSSVPAYWKLESDHINNHSSPPTVISLIQSACPQRGAVPSKQIQTQPPN